MKKPQFSLKTLLFMLTLAAVLLGWWADHQRLTDNIEATNQLALDEAIKIMAMDVPNAQSRLKRGPCKDLWGRFSNQSTTRFRVVEFAGLVHQGTYSLGVIGTATKRGSPAFAAE